METKIDKLNFIYFSETKNIILFLFKLGYGVSFILTNLVGTKNKNVNNFIINFNVIQAVMYDFVMLQLFLRNLYTFYQSPLTFFIQTFSSVYGQLLGNKSDLCDIFIE